MSDVIAKLRAKLRFTNAKPGNGEVNVTCPVCGYDRLVFDCVKYEVVCPRCGTVVYERLPVVNQPEFRIFDTESFLERDHYFPLNVVYESPGTYCSGVEGRQRLLQLNISFRQDEASLYNILKHVVSLLGIDSGSILETAFKIAVTYYRKAKSNTTRGTIVLASLYIACLLERKYSYLPRILTLLVDENSSKLLKVSRRAFWRTVLDIASVCNIRLKIDIEDRVRARILELAQVVAPKYNVDSTEVARKALELYEQYREVLGGRKPNTVAAALIYLALQEMGRYPLIKEVSTMAKCSAYAIRMALRNIKR